MRAILEEAVAVGNATARTLSFAPRESEGMAYYPGSAWFNMLWVGGYEFLDPPPEITADGVRQSPSDGARKLNSRIVFFYPATGVTPAMCMRLTGIGSQYLMASRDADGEFLDGARNYRLNLPADIPESRFWSVMLYDRQTRSMLQTDQPMPSLGSQSGTVEQNADGSTDLYFGPRGAGRQGAQLDPDRPRQGLVRDPAPLQPAPAVLRQELAAERDRDPSAPAPTDTTPRSTGVSDRFQGPSGPPSQPCSSRHEHQAERSASAHRDTRDRLRHLPNHHRRLDRDLAHRRRGVNAPRL